MSSPSLTIVVLVRQVDKSGEIDLRNQLRSLNQLLCMCRGVSTGKTAFLTKYLDTITLSQSGRVDYAHQIHFVLPKKSCDYAPNV